MRVKSEVNAQFESWKTERVFYSGDKFYSAVAQAISSAHSTIEIETYIFDLDLWGKEILNLLEMTAARGIRVRLLIDGVGCSQWNQFDIDRNNTKSVQTRVFHPLPWQHSHSKYWLVSYIRRFLTLLYTLNRRNHRKTWIIDQNEVYIGSINISARHLKKYSGELAWHDAVAQVSGPGIEQFCESFEDAWNYSQDYYSDQKIARTEKLKKFFGRLRTNASASERRQYQEDLITRIRGAKKRIWITNPYFVPSPKVLRALKKKAKSKTDVRILVPGECDLASVKFAMQGLYHQLLRSGARVYEYLPAVLHSKTLIVDQWCLVGSSNLDYRSFFHNLESDVVLSHASSQQQMEEQFLHDIKRSQEIMLTQWNSRPILRRIPEKFFLLLRRLL